MSSYMSRKAQVSTRKQPSWPYWVDLLNGRFAFVLVGGSQKIATFKKGLFEKYISVEAFQNLVMKEHFSGVSTALGGVGAAWLKHKGRRTYDSVGFAPLGTCPPGTLNLWSGFGVAPIEGDVEPFLSFVREVICAGSEKLTSFVLAWLAHLIQHPNEKPGTALVLRGAQGTGKSTFADMVMRLLGRHALMLPSAEAMTRNFNSHLLGKVLVVIEETPVRPREANLVKQIITQDRLLCEPKGVDAFEVENHIHLVLCTNEQRAVYAQHDERRYAVLDVSPHRRENTEYFAKLKSWYEGGGAEALLQFLQQYDWTSVNLRIAPRTEALLEQKLASLPLIDRACYGMLQAGVVGSSRDWDAPQPRTAFVDEVNAIRQKHESLATAEQVGKRLKVLFPGVISARESRGKIREWQWQLPPLAKARHDFELWLGQPITWDALEA